MLTKLLFYIWINKGLNNDLIELEITQLKKGLTFIERKGIDKLKKPNKENKQTLWEYLFWFHIIYNGGRKGGNIYLAIKKNTTPSIMLHNPQDQMKDLHLILEYLRLPTYQYNQQHLWKAHEFVGQLDS